MKTANAGTGSKTRRQEEAPHGHGGCGREQSAVDAFAAWQRQAISSFATEGALPKRPDPFKTVKS